MYWFYQIINTLILNIMKKIKSVLLLSVIAFALSSCYSLQHTVGEGARGNSTIEKKQWYALWGAVPLNEVDTQDMAKGASDYNIESQIKFVDYIISAFTGVITVTVQTVEVTK